MSDIITPDVNPLVFAMERTGITLTELSKDVLLSKQYINKTEYGCFTNINERLVRWLALRLGDYYDENISTKQINTWYQNFRQYKRNSTRYRLSQIEGEPIKDSPPVGNFIYDNEAYREEFVKWRSKYWNSHYQFAKDMCIHPYTVKNFEDGDCKGFPQELRTLLIMLESED
jgi:hypothetical protein